MSDADGPTTLPTSRKDRAIAKIVSFLARAVFREIEIYIPEPVPPGAPLITVSNHFGGFSDALVLLAVLPRRPGIVARDVIWKILPAAWLMNWIGGIPVHKPADKGSATSNDEMFASCYEALEENGHILIFPEGVTRNEPSIAEVKTGTARIAIGARAHGADDVQILPVGIHYENKAALRSRVFVNAARPLDVDNAVADHETESGIVTANDREAVRELTDAIDVRLRRAAPDFDNWGEARSLAAAADIALRSQLDDPSAAVPLGLRDRLANTLADRPADDRERISAAVSEYRDDLEGIGFTDAELHGQLSTGRFLRSLVQQVVIAVILFPFAIIGAAINWIPFLLVKAVGLRRVAPSVNATIKPIVAFVVYGITWGLVIWWAISKFGWQAGIAAFVLLPVYLAAVVSFIDRFVLLWRAFRRWRARTGSDGLEGHIAAHRTAVVEAVLAS
ncbi:MAG: 1-acyl-sn-glycerol-3-phosphate acyltransferase [Acidimicrobiia bacterium]|nr:1-acyl-sn-glycerol-3-phosphate acyltransferase [Acidimicrobiia bacterium]